MFGKGMRQRVLLVPKGVCENGRSAGFTVLKLLSQLMPDFSQMLLQIDRLEGFFSIDITSTGSGADRASWS